MNRRPEYRLYIDESGDHANASSDEVGKRYLGLAGVVFKTSEYDAFQTRLEQLKRDHLHYDPDDPPILHRSDIIAASKWFHVLQDPQRRCDFERDLLQLIQDTQFRLIAVVIDKRNHGEKHYRDLKHPYHYCTLAMLERYCGWLCMRQGRTGDVLAESRGGYEDHSLKRAYQGFYLDGASYHLNRDKVQRALTSKEVKIKPKHKNTAGLQLADILAHAATRDVLLNYNRISDLGSPFTERLVDLVQPKYNRQIYQNRINGYGRVFLS